MEKFTESLQSDSKAEFAALIKEGKSVSKTLLQASLDSADAVAWTVSLGVVMRRSSWLQALGLLYEVQLTIQDLLFKGPDLFSS